MEMNRECVSLLWEIWMSSRAGSGRRAVRMEDAMDWKRTGNRRGMELKTVPVCGNKIRCEAGEREEVLDFPMLQFPALSGTGNGEALFYYQAGRRQPRDLFPP